MRIYTSRDSGKGILRPNVRPMEGNGGFSSFRIYKENTMLIGKSPYAIDFKFNVTIWVKRVDDTEGYGVKVLIGCSRMI